MRRPHHAGPAGSCRRAHPLPGGPAGPPDPVTVIAGRGDPLFPLAYVREIFAGVAAPRKELLVLDSNVHQLFNEDLATVLPPLLQRLQAVLPAPEGAPT